MYSTNLYSPTPYSTDQYLETEVLAASPARLVQLLYESAMQAISIAIAAIDSGDIALRSQKIGKAVSIINELATSLDKSQAGPWASELIELYDYMARQLHAANFHQSKAPLNEVYALLSTLLDGWKTGDTASAGGCDEPVEINQFA